MSLLPTGFGSQGGGYEIEQSVRLRSDASAYFDWTPNSTGNQKTWTWSAWVKFASVDTAAGGQSLFYAGNSTTTQRGGIVYSNAGNQEFSIYGMQSGTTTNALALVTTARHRDPSAWYHLVVEVDTTQATASDRCKMYVNGVQQTDFSTATYPSQNTDLHFNQSGLVHATRHPSGNYLIDGYLSEVHFVDGQALDADSFGEFNSAGVWIPKAYTGTYGTNGFYLDFGNAGSIGADSSGNGNDWTANNIDYTSDGSTYDIMLDSPTDNYATYSPLDTDSATFSKGNLSVSMTTGAIGISRATMAVSSGKWYWENTITGTSQRETLGIALTTIPVTSNPATTSGMILTYGNSGNIYYNGSDQGAYMSTYGNGDVIGIAFDADAGSITYYKNGVSQGVGYASIPAGTYAPFFGDPSGTYATGVTANFGQQPFAYTPPTGYLPLSTSNLPAPSIADGSEHFNTVLYSGDGTSNHPITGVGFQPDFVWLKARSTSYAPEVYDAVRGVNLKLASSHTDAESSSGAIIGSFDSDGFTLDAANYANVSGQSYVAWNWKANGSGVTNTDGSITSTVSANVDAGFSIVSYTGTGSNATVGHGLDSAPEMVIIKCRTLARDWPVLHQSANSGNGHLGYTFLDTTAGFTTADIFNNTAPTSSVFTVKGSYSTVGSSGEDYIAYCFHSVEGYSKFGSYTGNGSADGPFVYTGFRPAFVMTKVTTTTGSWTIIDNGRDTYNVTEGRLYPNLSNAEETGAAIHDFLSNGFKLRNGTGSLINQSGATYIYMAFAEHPFGGDSVAPVTAR